MPKSAFQPGGTARDNWLSILLPGAEATTLERIAKQPNIIPGGVFVGDPSAGGTSAGAGTAGSTVTDLQLLISTIPVAEDGRIITHEYHNSLRSALLGLAGQLGVTLAKPTVMTFAPSFSPNDPAENWSQDTGRAYLNLEAVNLAEAQARARVELTEAAAAVTASSARIGEIAPIVSNIPAGGIPVSSLVEIANTAAQKAGAAQAAIQGALGALANPDAAEKLGDAATKAEEQLAAAGSVAGLAVNLVTIAMSLPFNTGVPFVAQLHQALAKAHEGLAQAGVALEKVKAAESIIREATRAQGGGKPSSCAGWLALHLPEGARLQSMRVFGQRQGTLQKFQVNMIRQKIQDSEETSLVTLDLKSAASTFQENANVQVQASGLTEKDVTVGNTLYKYLITAQASGVSGALAQISAIQITYTM